MKEDFMIRRSAIVGACVAMLVTAVGLLAPASAEDVTPPDFVGRDRARTAVINRTDSAGPLPVLLTARSTESPNRESLWDTQSTFDGTCEATVVTAEPNDIWATHMDCSLRFDGRGVEFQSTPWGPVGTAFKTGFTVWRHQPFELCVRAIVVMRSGEDFETSTFCERLS